MKKIILLTGLLLMSLNAFSQEKGDLRMRMRAVGVIPMDEASVGIIGGNVNVTNDLIPEIDFTYFFTKNFAAELILGTTKHEVVAVNTALGDVPLGSVMLLPPTLTLQYHFPIKNFKPYAGVGINYTFFYNTGQGRERSPVVTDVKYDNNVGFALQLGFDYNISDKVFLNFDIKKIYLKTDVTVNTALGVDVPADVDLNPWLIGAGVGFKLF